MHCKKGKTWSIINALNLRLTLKKSLPRLPLVEKADDFWAFSWTGRELANLHLNYEIIEPYKKCNILYAPFTNKGNIINYHVEKCVSVKLIVRRRIRVLL